MTDEARTKLTLVRRRVDIALDNLTKGQTKAARDVVVSIVQDALEALDSLSDPLSSLAMPTRDSVPPTSLVEQNAPARNSATAAFRAARRELKGI